MDGFTSGLGPACGLALGKDGDGLVSVFGVDLLGNGMRMKDTS